MGSSVSAAVDAVLAMAGTALPGVQVVEGELGTYVAAEQFIVMDVIGQDGPAAMGGQRFNEAYGITCLVRTYAGDTAMSTRRQRAMAMREAIRDALTADPALGGIVLHAYVETYTLRTGATEKGGSASECEFVIHVDNQTTS